MVRFLATLIVITLALVVVPITSAQDPNQDLVSWWGMDDEHCSIYVCTTGNSLDSVSTNHLTQFNTPLWVDGVYGNSLLFNGVNEYLEGSYAELNGITSGLTVSFWVKFDNFTTQQTIISKTDGVTLGWWLFTDATSLAFRYYDTGGNLSSLNSPNGILTAGVWHMIVISFSGGNLTIRLNGNQVANRFAFMSSSTAALSVARKNGGTQYFKGNIDELAYWLRGLSVDEIRTIENGGNGTAHNALVPTAAPGFYNATLYSGRDLFVDLTATAGDVMIVWLLLLVSSLQLFVIFRDAAIATAARRPENNK